MALLTREDILACSGHVVVVDTETNGLLWWENQIIGIGIECPTAREGKGVRGYVHTCSFEQLPYGKSKKHQEWLGAMDYSRSKRGRRLSEEVVYQPTRQTAVPNAILIKHFASAVAEIASDPKTTLIGHNLKFDLHMLGVNSWDVPCKIMDTMVMVHLIDSRLLKSLDASESVFLGRNSKRQQVAKADKRLGKKVWLWDEKVLEDYCTNDCVVTYQLAQTLYPELKERGLTKLYTLQMRYLRLLQKMERHGILITTVFCREAIRQFEQNIREMEKDLYDTVGYSFNWRSSSQLSKAIYDDMGVTKPSAPYNPEEERFDIANFRTAKLYTESATSTPLLVKEGHPLRGLVLGLRESDKLKEYAQKFIDLRDNNGFVHASFNLARTLTGRLSCVSGDTLLMTSRGVFRFDEYIPVAGDLVLTHRGRWQSVLRKIFKGFSPMFSVHLSNNSVLKCTEDHQLLTPNGWKRMGDLSIGDKVYSYEHVQELCKQSRPCKGCTSIVSGQPKQADYPEYCTEVGDDIPQCNGDYPSACGSGSSNSRTASTLLTVENTRKERYAGQVGRATSSLQRTNWRRPWVSDAKSRRPLCTRTPQGFYRVFGVKGIAAGTGRSSHRRGQDQQQYGQPGSSQLESSWRTTSEIAQINSLGRMGVFDIEVAGDHSYLSQGFLNHNSSSPNLQQLPSEKRKVDLENAFVGGAVRQGVYNLRQAIVARSGSLIVSIDHKQQEMRMLAILSQEPVLLQAMIDREDIHLRGAIRIWGDCGESLNKIHRDWNKCVSFGLIYGLGEETLQEYFEKMGVQADARQVKEQYFDAFPGLQPWFQEVIRYVQENGCVQYWSGRYWYADNPNEGYKGVNALIQGGCADLISVAALRIDQILTRQGWGSILSIIHDEILLEVREEVLEEACPVLVRAMEVEDLFDVPFAADIEVGDSYGTLGGYPLSVNPSEIDWKAYT